jgi:hypothetical protein
LTGAQSVPLLLGFASDDFQAQCGRFFGPLSVLLGDYSQTIGYGCIADALFRAVHSTDLTASAADTP